jgi:limonene-1,2-epoxide hydrolase
VGKEQEDIVLEFLRCTEPKVDVDVLANLMTDDVVWQVNVPMSKVVVGRAAARAQIEGHVDRSIGMLPGSVIRAVASNDREVFVERVELAEMAGQRVTVYINAVFEVREGKIAAWREYFDSFDLARQLGIDATILYQE